MKNKLFLCFVPIVCLIISCYNPSFIVNPEDVYIEEGLVEDTFVYSYGGKPLELTKDDIFDIYNQLENYLLKRNGYEIPILRTGFNYLISNSYQRYSDIDLCFSRDEIIGKLNVPDFSDYLHLFTNYWDAYDLFLNTAAPLFFRTINNAGNGYMWKGYASKTDLPIPVNPDDKGFSTIYRVPVKTGSEFKYYTHDTNYMEFNGQPVAADDYVNAYKWVFSSIYKERNEMHEEIKNLYRYIRNNFSEKQINEEEWANVGIKSVMIDNQPSLEFVFNYSVSPQEAAYYLSKPEFSPKPLSFLEKALPNYQNNRSAFYALTAGPYSISDFSSDKCIIEKNNNIIDGFYKIKGVVYYHKNNKEEAKEWYSSGKLSYIDANELDIDRDDFVSFSTLSGISLNIVNLTQDRWIELYGENGSAFKNEKDYYYRVNPIVNNPNFYKGIYYCLNRKRICSSLSDSSIVPNGDPFSEWGSLEECYLEGEPFIRSRNHADNVSPLFKETDKFGYSYEKAKAYFKYAIDELLNNKIYKNGETIILKLHKNISSVSYDALIPEIIMDIEETFNKDGRLFIKIEEMEDTYLTNDSLPVGVTYDLEFVSLPSGGNRNNYFRMYTSDWKASNFNQTRVVKDLFFLGRNWSFNEMVDAFDKSVNNLPYKLNN